MVKSDTKLLDFKFIISVILLSIFSVAYIDVFSTDVRGYAVSYFVFIVVLLLALFKLHYAIVSTIILQVTIPPFPRNILDVYSALQVEKTVQYNTISSITLGKLSLIQHLTFILALIILYKLISCSRSIVIGRWIKYFLLTLLFSTFFATIYFTFITHDLINLREIITSSRLPLYLIIGVIYFNYLNVYCGTGKTVWLLNRMFIAITIIESIRVPFFIISSISEKIPSLDLGVVPHIPIAVVLAAFYIIEMKIGAERKYMSLLIIMSIFAILSPSRGHIAILLMSTVVFLNLNKFNIRYLKYIAVVVFMFVLPIIFIYFYNERLFDFIFWKLTFFTGDISDSGRVRIYEFYNILSEGLLNPVYLLFGKGLLGYFTFDNYPLPRNIVLDLQSYSHEELMHSKFYHPHFFINFMMLKFGLIGLLLYVMIIYEYYKKGKYIFTNININAENLNIIFFVLSNALLALSFLFELHFRNYYVLIFSINFMVMFTLLGNVRGLAINNRQ